MNHQEYRALLDDTELNHEARLVYMTFRRFMDYETGITGNRRVVDYNELLQSLEYTPPRGSTGKPKRYSRDQIKRVIQQLVKRSYLIPLHETGRPGNKMVFRLPLANSDLFRPDEERHRSATEAPPQEYPVFRRAVEDIPATGAPQEERHISVIHDTKTITTGPNDRFPMSMDWQPTARLSELCRKSGINPDEEIIKQITGQFIAYYLSTPGRIENAARWDSLLLQWIMRERVGKANNMGGRNHATSKPTFNNRPQSGAAILAEGCAGAFDEYASETA